MLGRRQRSRRRRNERSCGGGGDRLAADSPCLRSRCAAIKHRSHSQCATGRFRNSVSSDSFWWVQRVTRKSDCASHRTGAQIPRGRKRGKAPNAGPTSDEARGLGVEPNGAGGRRRKVRARGQRNQKTKTGPDRREEEGTHNNNASAPAQLRKRFSPRLAHRRQTTAATSSVGGRVSLPPSFLVGRERGGGTAATQAKQRRRPERGARGG